MRHKGSPTDVGVCHAYTRRISNSPNTSRSPATAALTRLASPQNFHTPGNDAGTSRTIQRGVRSPAHACFIAGFRGMAEGISVLDC